jgi:hypothetical protein
MLPEVSETKDLYFFINATGRIQSSIMYFGKTESKCLLLAPIVFVVRAPRGKCIHPFKQFMASV